VGRARRCAAREFALTPIAPSFLPRRGTRTAAGPHRL